MFTLAIICYTLGAVCFAVAAALMLLGAKKAEQPYYGSGNDQVSDSLGFVLGIVSELPYAVRIFCRVGYIILGPLGGLLHYLSVA